MNQLLTQPIESFYVERESDITCNKWYWTFLPVGVASTEEEMQRKILEYFKDGFEKIKELDREDV